MNTSLSRIFAIGIVGLALIPMAASATTAASEGELRASIQAALLSDPRTDTLTPDQLDALVTALLEDSQAKHLKPMDVTYTPRVVTNFGVTELSNQAGSCPLFSCAFARSFGLDGSDDFASPLLLLVSSGLRIMIIRRMFRNTHDHGLCGCATVAASPAPPPPTQYV